MGGQRIEITTPTLPYQTRPHEDFPGDRDEEDDDKASKEAIS
jgi:hypothetical protein